ncbi:hypothetical protein PM082_013483 [Marasmius tenuissimus]|nr:hypothetical protein PM082_013483 [Marasmius tenuissimus]
MMMTTTSREGGQHRPSAVATGEVGLALPPWIHSGNRGQVPKEPRLEALKNIKPPFAGGWENCFEAPNATDARGPCPGMNTLANHGFLPRGGRNITVSIALKAAQDAFNVQRDVLITAAKLAVLSSPLDDQFALTDIVLHGNFEHDAFLSRFDEELGDPLAFSEQIYTVLADSNPGVDYYNVTSGGQIQRIRTEQSRANNPNFRNTVKEFLFRSTESSFYLAVFGDPFTGVAPKELLF